MERADYLPEDRVLVTFDQILRPDRIRAIEASIRYEKLRGKKFTRTLDRLSKVELQYLKLYGYQIGVDRRFPSLLYIYWE